MVGSMEVKFPLCMLGFSFTIVNREHITCEWLLDIPLRRNYVSETLSLLTGSGGVRIAADSVLAGWSKVDLVIWTSQLVLLLFPFC